MVTVKQYPDVLTWVKTTGGSSSYDSDGNLIVTGGSTTTVTMQCRAQANSQGKQITGVDGKSIVFDWLILVKLAEAQQIPYDASVSVTRNGVVRAIGTVKRCVIDQLNAKVYL